MSEILLRLNKLISYSELVAAKSVINELGYTEEKVVVTSRIADASGQTRSVIVASLKLLELAGFITTRSLGMKGTYIKVLDKQALHEILKF